MKLLPKKMNAVLMGVFILLLTMFNYAPTQAATLSSIDVTPINPTVDIGQTQEFTATGTFSDGSTQVLGASVTAITAGSRHSCVLLVGGAVQCWGDNFAGELGNGTTIDSKTPVTVSGISGATAIAAGEYQSCALLVGGAVQCWGANDRGQLGNGPTSAGYSSTPVAVVGITTATAIAEAYDHGCALLAGGMVQCWGWNYYGELGNGTTTDSRTPVAVSGISTAKAIAAGGNFTCAALGDGTVQCWGHNSAGQLGNGTTIDSTTPVTVSGISTATAVSAGNDGYSCALLGNGTVQCWGGNTFGELGNGTTTDSTTPVTVSGLSGVTAISTKYEHTCALLSNGTLQCWGSNFYGELGNRASGYFTTPVLVSGISTATAVAAGDTHSCALLADGQVQCWGSNYHGLLGIGDTRDHTAPVYVAGYVPYVAGLPSVMWSSSDTTAATVDAYNGLAIRRSAGTATITATSDTISGTANIAPVSSVDLVIDRLKATPNLAVPGQVVTVTATVRNQGITAAANFQIDLYKNLLTKPTVGQVGDVTCNVATLAAGATTTCTDTVSYDAAGFYSAQVDTMNAVAESNETNNLRGPILVRMKLPDLRIVRLKASTTTPTVGTPVTLTATVMNLSLVNAGAFEIDFYNNLASAPSVSQVGDVTCAVSGLAKLASTTCTGTVTYTAPGTYQIWAQADTLNAVAETKEGNNVKGPLKITVH